MKIDLWEIIKAVWPTFIMLWPIWIFIVVLILIQLIFYWLDLEIDNWRIRRRFKKGEQWRSDRDLIHWLRSMKPKEFELYVVELFKKLGYNAEHVGGSNDHGVDVIAEKDGVKHYIQCKKYFSRHQVGSPEIRDFYGAIADHLTTGKAYFITTNKFTLEAEKFAEDKPIELIDSFRLAEYIHLAEKKSQNSEVRGGANLQCPECDGALVERDGKFGKFLGCSNYPKCKFTKKI